MKSLAKFAYVLMAMAVGAVSWADEADLAHWRMTVATNGYASVERKVKVPQDVQQTIWKCYREHIGIEGVQMSKPRLVATNECGAVYDLPFTTADGARHNFGVVLSEGTARPLYRVGRGLADSAKLAELNPAEYVSGMFLADNKGGARIASPGRALSSLDAKVVLGFSDDAVVVPFDEYLFYFIDDCPLANWGHPARCVFVKPDLSEFAVLHVDMPARVLVGGRDVELSPVGGDVAMEVSFSAAAGTRSSAMLMGAGAKSAFPAVTDGDPANCYALLISGGGDAANNHGRYWNDMCFAYNVLRQRYGLPRQNIKVLWAKGNPNADLCWTSGKCCWKTCLGKNAFPTDDLSDFDQDGHDDISGAATVKNMTSILNSYASLLRSTDQLFVFVTDHGSKGISSGDKEPAVLCLWGENLSDVKFAELTKDIKCPVFVALETCYSGGMVEEFCGSNPNRAIATADGFDSSACGNYAMDVWVYNFFSALCGYYPGGTYSTSISGVAPVDVRSVGERCDADCDGDGRVSFYEAALFAYKNNPIANDTPEIHASTANLYKKLFVTQYADAPAVVVKEKVLTPTLSPASGTLGFAPCTVTASCGTSGATIRYTMDGSTPTGKSAVYSGGITVTGDATVTIRAFKSEMEASDAVSVAYTVRKTVPEKALITSVSQGDSSSGIVISWSGGAGTVSYDILRSETSSMAGAKAVATGLAASTSSWADLNAVPGKSYYYQIRSINAYGSTLSAASQDAYLMLNPPARVSASVAAIRLSQVTVNLSWQSSTGASAYRVYRQGAGGSLVAASAWQASCSFTDTAAISGGTASLTYYVQSASDAAGTHPSAYSEPAYVSAQLAAEDMSLVCSSDMFVLKPGGKASCNVELKYADGVSEENFMSGATCSLVGLSGVSASVADGKYERSLQPYLDPSTGQWSGRFVNVYVPPRLDIVASELAADQRGRARVQYTFNGVTLSDEIDIIVHAGEIVRSIDISSMPFVMPGAKEQVSAKCKCYSGSTADEGDVDVKWAVIGGGGATIDEDGELTAWDIDYRTNVVVQASVETILGLVTATRTINVSPATIEQKTVELPPLGGSYTNYFGVLNKSTYGEFVGEYWLSGLRWNSSSSPDPKDISITITVGGGKNMIGVTGYLFLSFNANRNPGKDRETIFKLRWDGGGIDFKIFQREAPYANNPVVSGVSNGIVTASSTTDGSVLHYATDGEEPSEDSPVLANSLSFEENTAFAVKAFGDWMQASDTVYADVVGKGAQWDEVEISFVPAQPGLSSPAKRTYKVSEKFGELPSFPKTGGLFFKGWTLHEGSDKLVSAADAVPNQDATLYAVWSPVVEDKPSWVALPWNFKSAMVATMKVYDDLSGTYLDPSVCIIGIEDADGVCRGSSENGFGDMQSELNGKDGLYVFGVYSLIESGTENGLRIRIWNRQKGFMEVLNGNLSFSAGGELGSEGSPFVVHVETGFAVNFDANGGQVDEPVRKVREGYAIGELPESSRDGHLFSGWYTARSGGSRITSETVVSADMTVYARWAVAWTLTLDTNGGELEGGDKLLVEDGKAIGELPVPVWADHVFLGWFTEAVGGKQVGATVKATADVTYHAHWQYVGAADENTIVFNIDGTYQAGDDRSFTLVLLELVGSLSAPKISVKGLPTGLKYDDKAMTISGKATKPGVYTVTVSATNATVKKPVTATFELKVPNLADDAILVDDEYGPYIPGKTYVETIAAADGCAVTGLPSGMKWMAKALTDKTVGAVPANSVYGAATKPGSYTVYFTTTTADRKKHTATAMFVVGPLPKLTVETSGSGTGKVTGAGEYAASKKVSLKATADTKDAAATATKPATVKSVFMGWYDGETLLSQSASYSLVMPETDMALTAKFITADEDKASIELAVNGEELRRVEDSAPYRTNVWAGVYLEWHVAAEALSATTVKVAGLPSGLKFAAKPVTSKVGSGKTAVVVTNVPANTIYGVPTAASKIDAKTGNVKPSEVKVTVTTAGKSSQIYQIDTVVDALPAWAQGSFAGELGNWESASAEASAAALALADKSADMQGTVSLTVSAAGKVSGKAQGDGLAYTLAAPYYSGFEVVPGDDGLVSNFLADVTASWSYKAGSKTVKTNDVVRMAVQDNGVGGFIETSLPNWRAWQYNWKVEPWKTLGKSFDKQTRTYAVLSDGSFSEDKSDIDAALGSDVVGRVTLKFSANGTVSVAGEFVSGYDEKKAKYTTVKASGSTTLVPVDEEHGVVFVYLTPKGLSPHSRCLDVPWPEE